MFVVNRNVGRGTVGLLLAMVVLSLASASETKPNRENEAAKTRYAKQTRLFMENRGQWDSRARYLSRTPGLNFWVTNKGFVLDYFHKTEKQKVAGTSGDVVGMEFVGASSSPKCQTIGNTRLTQDFVSKKPVKGVQSYESVVTRSIYPNVDVRSYTDGGSPRYDIIANPGADVSKIKLDLKGVSSVKVDSKGDLVYQTSLGPKKHTGLFAYQVVNGQRRKVAARFAMLSDRRVGFTVGKFDKTKRLVIDPLIYGTYYGGDAGFDEVRAVITDSSGGVYLCGRTQSPRFPSIYGPYGFAYRGGEFDAFLSKLQDDAYSHDYAALIGGSGSDMASKLTIDQFGDVWVAGLTDSTDFPIAKSTRTNDIWMIRFAQSSSSILDPWANGKTQGYMLSGAGDKFLVSMMSVPRPSTPGSPIELIFGGDSDLAVDQVPGSQTSQGFFVTLSYLNGTFSVIPELSQYVGDQYADLTGLAVDANGNIYISGSNLFNGNADTSVTPGVFRTTAGVYEGGRLARGADIYVRKYNSAGQISYSCLIGGNSQDLAGGWHYRHEYDPAAQYYLFEYIGNSITVDEKGNAYVLGWSRSFNYPRTRGVYGETFTGNTTQVVVTKLNPTGSSLIYSTNLRTNGGWIYPIGIAIDQRGTAYMTGDVAVANQYNYSGDPPDPMVPNGDAAGSLGSIPTTADAIRAAYTRPASPEIRADDSWLLVLNPSATDLIYGSYIGGFLDDYIYSPWVNPFGDLWLCGSTESYRDYVTYNADFTTITFHSANADMRPFVTTLAFKASEDTNAAGGQPNNIEYPYAIDEYYWGPGQYWDPQSTAPWSASHRGDGYVLKYRLGLPVIASFNLAPATIPGGDPTGSATATPPSTTATVTVNQAAPTGGINIVMTIADPTIASFSPIDSVSQTTLFIPAGATTVNTLVYSRKVSARSTVQIRAEYEGNYLIKSLVVEPWLQNLTFTSNSIVGGNPVTGRITLYAAAPGPVRVNVVSESGNDPIVQPGVITIPTGQDFGTFQLVTKGVDSERPVKLTANLLGVAINQTIRIQPAALRSIEVAPQTVADGLSVAGVLTLTGEAGPTPVVARLSVLNDPNQRYIIKPAKVTINEGQTRATFVVQVPVEPGGTTLEKTILAVRTGTSGQTATGSFFVTPIALKSVAILQSTLPASIYGGFPTKGSVTINDPAPASGLPIYLFVNNDNAAKVPTKVTVPAGATTATFTVKTFTALSDKQVVIAASRSTVNPFTTTVDPSTYKTTSLSVLAHTIAVFRFVPSQVAGGDPSIGVVKLNHVAPRGGLVVYLKSANPSIVSIPSQVTIPAGQAKATFNAQTIVIAGKQSILVTASRGQNFPAAEGITVTAPLVVNQGLRLVSMSFNPTTVQGGGTTMLSLTLNGSNPGTTPISIKLTSSDPTLLNLPASVTIQPGQPSSSSNYTVTISVKANTVARNLSTTVTASLAETTQSATVTVTR